MPTFSEFLAGAERERDANLEAPPIAVESVRDAGLDVLPVLIAVLLVAAVIGFAMLGGPALCVRFCNGCVEGFFRKSRLTRGVLTGSLFWIAVVSLYFGLLHDFSYGFAQEELIQVLGWTFFPPSVLLLGYWTYVKLVLPGSRE